MVGTLRAVSFATVALLGAGARGQGLAAQTVQGQVTDAASRRPIAGVMRLLDETGAEAARATLAVDGRYTVQIPEPGRYRLRLESPGYQVAISSLMELEPGLTLVMNLEVRALTPTTLDTVVVVGAAVPYRLLGFYDRRAKGFGDFITREEFERYYPTRVTDVLRRMMGLTVAPNPYYQTRGDTREYLVLNTRLSTVEAQSCAALVFIDGAYVGNTGTVNLDEILNVEFVEAVETYNGAGNTPIEFSRTGSECGVVSVWSRSSADRGPVLSSHLDLGGQFGGRVSGRGLEDGRIGVQATITFAGFLEFSPAANALAGIASGDGTARTGWQVLASLRVRPLGTRSPWYVGTGYSAVTTIVGQAPFSESVDESYPLLLTGLTLPLRSLRPFVELQLLGPFTADRRQVHVFTGLGFRIY